ncbi:hypothetical protein [Mycobacterium sp.]|uniref:hypothetical protein n=1 Tax=Mycobacterium sp. TaxID=1785 RepID=UPI0031D90D4C
MHIFNDRSYQLLVVRVHDILHTTSCDSAAPARGDCPYPERAAISARTSPGGSQRRELAFPGSSEQGLRIIVDRRRFGRSLGTARRFYIAVSAWGLRIHPTSDVIRRVELTDGRLGRWTPRLSFLQMFCALYGSGCPARAIGFTWDGPVLENAGNVRAFRPVGSV